MNKEHYFISIQGSYKNLELALFKNEECLTYNNYAEIKTSAQLIPLLESLLTDHSLNLSDLSFIAVNHGPGAFTSLRVIISTINGIAFATNIPLIGVDGIFALAQESISYLEEQAVHYCLVLLNAFNNEAYYALYTYNNGALSPIFHPTYDSLEHILEKIKNVTKESKIAIIGNGSTLHEEAIKKHFSSNALFFPSLPTASARVIGQEAFKKWNDKKDLTTELIPLYLKTQRFQPKYESLKKD